MIQEDYVSFETAKLLKEKGFDELTELSYELSTGCPKKVPCRNTLDTEYVSKITLQMAMKWLREVHYLWIDIEPLTGNKWTWCNWLMNDPTQKMGESLQIISNYNEACEAAIKYCLENLI